MAIETFFWRLMFYKFNFVLLRCLHVTVYCIIRLRSEHTSVCIYPLFYGYILGFMQVFSIMNRASWKSHMSPIKHVQESPCIYAQEKKYSTIRSMNDPLQQIILSSFPKWLYQFLFSHSLGIHILSNIVVRFYLYVKFCFILLLKLV